MSRWSPPGNRQPWLTILLPSGSLVFSASAGAEDTPVKIDNFTFAPQRVTVKVGTAVSCTSNNAVRCRLDRLSKAFRSRALDTDDKLSFTFTTVGVYEYFCSLHPHMTGTIVVEGGCAPINSVVRLVLARRTTRHVNRPQDRRWNAVRVRIIERPVRRAVRIGIHCSLV